MLLHSIQLRINAVKNALYASLFTVSAILFSQQICVAQNTKKALTSDTSSANMEIGISGGLSLNSFSDGQPQTGQNTGYTAGLSLQYKIHKNLTLQVEANFMRQGGQLISFKDDTRIGLPESFSTKNVKNSSIALNGVEVPLLVKYNFKIHQAWKPAFYLGGSYIYNYNATDKYQKTGSLLPGEDMMATVSDFQNVTRQYMANRFNMIVGADVQMPLFDNVKLLLDFRYLTGLSAARLHYSYMEKVGFGSDIRTNSFVSKIGLVLPLAR